MMHGWGFGCFPGFMWLGPIMGFAFMALMIWLIVRLVRGPVLSRTPSDAARILDERLARGEIDEEEYRRRKAALQK